MEQSDEALLAACRGGDEAAWERLVTQYQRLVYSIPRRAGLDVDAASDVYQTVFVHLVASLDAIERPDRLRAWLVTTAKRETWRFLARRRSGPALAADLAENDAGVPEPADAAPLADEALELLETQHEVRRAVESLDARCRELLTLLFYTAEPPPYAEIAARLAMPEGSVGPTRARCLKKLMDRVGELAK
jgi:RNA polymerase sigma factor (sigma-70 family)